MSGTQRKGDYFFKKLKLSYIRSESIAADWSKACSQGDTQEQWPGNGSGMLGMAIVTAKAANRERWKSAEATRDCIPVKKKIKVLLAWQRLTYSFWTPLPWENSMIPFPLPEIINHLPWTQCGGHQPSSYLSAPCHCLGDRGPSKLAAPVEILTRATLTPGRSLDPLAYSSI